MSAHKTEWLIRFAGLSQGTHEFGYEIEDSFFEGREGSLIHKAQVKAEVILHKGAGAMQLELKLTGTMHCACVRCLEDMELPVDVHHTLLVREVENPNHEDDDDDAIHIGIGATEIDMESHFYDFLSLQVPFNPMHLPGPDGNPACNAEVVKHIKAPQAEPEAENSQWDALKKLKLN